MNFENQNYSEEHWSDFIDYYTEDIPEDEIQNFTTLNGYNITIVEEVSFSSAGDSTVIYRKNILFHEHKILAIFFGADRAKDYVYEFDKLIDSVQFDSYSRRHLKFLNLPSTI